MFPTYLTMGKGFILSYMTIEDKATYNLCEIKYETTYSLCTEN